MGRGLSATVVAFQCLENGVRPSSVQLLGELSKIKPGSQLAAGRGPCPDRLTSSPHREAKSGCAERPTRVRSDREQSPHQVLDC